MGYLSVEGKTWPLPNITAGQVVNTFHLLSSDLIGRLYRETRRASTAALAPLPEGTPLASSQPLATSTVKTLMPGS